MRAVFITMIVMALWIEAPSASAGVTDYGKMSKAQLVHQLGLPAEIILLRGPEPEIWRYYYTHDDGVVLLFSIGLREGLVATYSYDPMFDPRRILSPDRPADLAKIWSYIRADREKLRRAKSR
jgi:hypothetical protein